MPPAPHQVQNAFQAWFGSLKASRSGLPARGTLAAALWILERLRHEYSLDIQSHMAPGGAQISGLNSGSVERILNRFGENRRLLGEGGRTNRGVPGTMRHLLDALKPLKLEEFSETDRNSALEEMQRFLVERIVEFHARKRLSFDYDERLTTSALVRAILNAAREVGKAGPVAQYLVGAKLACRFKSKRIANEGYSAADAPGGRAGDFEIGDTAFHVTVSPARGVYEKCEDNLRKGLRTFLLVREDHLIGTRQNAANVAPDKIAVESIESFVANNIEELAEFSKDGLKSGVRVLLEKYNERVNAIEHDKSLLIEFPRNLK